MEQALIRTDKGMVPVRLTDESIERVISISDDDVKWLKISEAGFMDGHEFLTSELTGKILDIHPYWIKWLIGEPPEKIPFTKLEDEPEGFELRTDIKILLGDGEIMGLSLASSSSHAISRYMRRLQALRLVPSEIITTMKTRAVVNRENQKFTILDFQFVPPTPENSPPQVVKTENPPQPAYCPDWEAESERETDVPF
ncbi:MAG: hypothetical protein V2A69_05210 [Pseudomonadota bacterium]